MTSATRCLTGSNGCDIAPLTDMVVMFIKLGRYSSYYINDNKRPNAQMCEMAMRKVSFYALSGSR